MSGSFSIIVDQQIAHAADAFSCFGDVQLINSYSINRRVLKQTDILLIRSVTRVDESLLKNTPVRFVGSATSGIDNIDLDYLKHSGIAFCHSPGSNARSVAEYVLSSLIVIAEQNNFNLKEKTIGIIGCGQIGSRVKKFMQGMGMKCLLNDPPRASIDNSERWSDLEQLFSADIISLHVPLTEKGEYPTSNMVDEDFLSQLKPNVVFINTSRGEIVDETALLQFRKKNSRAVLILDVWRNEPDINIDLLNYVAIPTPHIAGYSFDGKQRAAQMLNDALCRFTGIKSAFASQDLNEKKALNLKFETGLNLSELAVLQAYDVRTDASALRDVTNIPETKRAAYFDGLRKEYPVRYEFGNFTVSLKNRDNSSIQQLKQWGFNLQTL